jgi:hypothetical protein
MTDLLLQLETLRRDCEVKMLAQAGEASICQLHKDGRVSGGLKYLEGRLVALSELTRAVKQPGGDNLLAAAVPPLLDAFHDKWQRQLVQHQSNRPLSMPWVAYCQGGLDAICDIQAWLESANNQ